MKCKLKENARHINFSKIYPPPPPAPLIPEKSLGLAKSECVAPRDRCDGQP